LSLRRNSFLIVAKVARLIVLAARKTGSNSATGDERAGCDNLNSVMEFSFVWAFPLRYL